jgi:beta-phosphoglucomutase
MLPGVYDFIKKARTLGLKIGMASSSKNARTTLNRLQINNVFDVMLDANDILKGKPYPDVYLEVSHRMAVNPRSCLVFEDAFSGIKAAKRAGMSVVGMGEPAQLLEADITIESFIDLDPNQIINNLFESTNSNKRSN